MSNKQLVVLDETECWDLARTHVVGRIGVSGDNGEAPTVLPVNYVVDGRSIVFRTELGTKLSLLRNHPASFEVDHIDLSAATGWSVLIKGRAEVLTHWESDHMKVSPWVPGDHEHFVRVVPTEVTGRRIHAEYWVDQRAYL